MGHITVDRWILEHLRGLTALQTAFENRIYIFSVPSGTVSPYVLIQLISGTRQPKTQVLRDAGRSRFQIDVFTDDQYQGREDIEEIMTGCMIGTALDRGLRIEQIEVAGPRQLPCEEGYRFSCDVMITWIGEE